VESFPFRCKRCGRDFEIDFIKRDLIWFENDEDLVCELSRESDPACHQLCGAPLSGAHFDAYAAGCTKSTLDFVVDEEE
jgi:hypothetical protein